ncbi:MAG: hypothetical protein E7211_08755 [Clostridium lundense]|nr:hypothetical protein [Clostridium lundense]
MEVTKLEDIKNKAAIEVTLPGWDEEPFICKLKRISVMDLSAQGKIPNTLLGTVSDLFGKKLKIENGEGIKNMAETINLFCKCAMVEPTYEEVEGINPLTDDQRLAIFDFTQSGVRKIRPSDTK